MIIDPHMAKGLFKTRFIAKNISNQGRKIAAGRINKSGRMPYACILVANTKGWMIFGNPATTKIIARLILQTISMVLIVLLLFITCFFLYLRILKSSYLLMEDYSRKRLKCPIGKIDTIAPRYSPCLLMWFVVCGVFVLCLSCR